MRHVKLTAKQVKNYILYQKFGVFGKLCQTVGRYETLTFHEVHLTGQRNVGVGQRQLHAGLGKVAAQILVKHLLQEAAQRQEMTGPAVPGRQEVLDDVMKEAGVGEKVLDGLVLHVLL